MNTNPFALALERNDPSWPQAIETTAIPGLLISKRQTSTDNRGFFREAIELRDLELVLGKKINVTQWNHSQSHPDVIRGFHSEPWEKIIYVVKGNVIGVIVDFRTDSPTFGKALKFELGENNPITLYLPKGMGNSICNPEKEDAEYLYMITDYFEGKPTPAVNWNDPLLTRQFGGWPVSHPTISEKDKKYPTLREKFSQTIDFSQFPWLKE